MDQKHKNEENEKKKKEKDLNLDNYSSMFQNTKYSLTSSLSEEEFNDLKQIRNKIINKINLVLEKITPQTLRRATLASRGTTLKSLMNAFHIIQLHLKAENEEEKVQKTTLEFFKNFHSLPLSKENTNDLSKEEEKEYILESIQNFIAVQKKNFIKQKRFE